MSTNRIFTLSKRNFMEHNWCEQEESVAEGQVLLKVDRVALTSNNATYAMLGQQMHYWDFFQSYSPVEESGVLPVWGFAEVIESRADGIQPGERFFGFWPFARFCVVSPEKITVHGFLDSTPPKPNLALAYRSFQKLPGLNEQTENINALLRPLGTTAYLLANELAKSVDKEAITQIAISSASSKTALATAAVLKSKLQAAGATTVLTGLTSAGNLDFVVQSKLFDNVVCYDELSALKPSKNSIYVDFSGSTEVRLSVHQAFAGNLVQSLSIGATDWLGVTKRTESELQGPTPVIFFAPTFYQETAKEIGHAALASAIENSMGLLTPLIGNMQIKEVSEEQEIESSWEALLAGKIKADEALILRF